MVELNLGPVGAGQWFNIRLVPWSVCRASSYHKVGSGQAGWQDLHMEPIKVQVLARVTLGVSAHYVFRVILLQLKVEVLILESRPESLRMELFARTQGLKLEHSITTHREQAKVQPPASCSTIVRDNTVLIFSVSELMFRVGRARIRKMMGERNCG